MGRQTPDESFFGTGAKVPEELAIANGQHAWPPTARCLACAVPYSEHHFLKGRFHCNSHGSAVANKKFRMSSFAAVEISRTSSTWTFREYAGMPI